MGSSKYTVSEIVKDIEQPDCGLLPIMNFNKFIIDDGFTPEPNENLNYTDIGLAVDYLTRFMLGIDKTAVFELSHKGLSRFKASLDGKQAEELVSRWNIYFANMVGLDDLSIMCACNLVKYDACYRGIPFGFDGVEIHPDEITTINIRAMVMRTLKFFETFGPIVDSGGKLVCESGRRICTGIYDYLTADTIWDIKTGVYTPANTDTLQVLMYYIIGSKENDKRFKNISKLGIFNSRYNEVYTIMVSKIDKELIRFIAEDILEYPKENKLSSILNDYAAINCKDDLSWRDLDKFY